MKMLSTSWYYMVKTTYLVWMKFSISILSFQPGLLRLWLETFSGINIKQELSPFISWFWFSLFKRVILPCKTQLFKTVYSKRLHLMHFLLNLKRKIFYKDHNPGYIIISLQFFSILMPCTFTQLELLLKWLTLSVLDSQVNCKRADYFWQFLQFTWPCFY